MDRGSIASIASTHALARFACVGGIATAIQYGLLVALVSAGLAPLTATTVAFAASAAYNYAANRTFTFRSRRSHRTALPRFIVVATIGAGLNGAAFWLAFEQVGIHYLIAQVVATTTTLAWNFVAHRRWTFAQPH